MNPISFGEDAQGNLYVAAQGGNVYVFYSATASDLIFADGFD